MQKYAFKMTLNPAWRRSTGAAATTPPEACAILRDAGVLVDVVEPMRQSETADQLRGSE